MRLLLTCRDFQKGHDRHARRECRGLANHRLVDRHVDREDAERLRGLAMIRRFADACSSNILPNQISTQSGWNRQSISRWVMVGCQIAIATAVAGQLPAAEDRHEKGDAAELDPPRPAEDRPPKSDAAGQPVLAQGVPGDSEIREAFRRAHDGFSSDELLIRQTLTDQFLRELGLLASADSTRISASANESAQSDSDQFRSQEKLADLQRESLRRLINLRKAGRLDVPTRRRSQTESLPHPMVAEIAVRTLLDRHQVTTDDVLIDPRLRAELQREAEKLQPGVDADRVRKAVLKLRKVRQLRPELVLRVAQWKRRVVTMDLEDVDPATLPEQPGVYLFRDQSGYLYIGEAEDLAERMCQHFTGSHNTALSKLLEERHSSDVSLELHVFSADSPASRVRMRRAYESELIRSRQPAFNLRP